MIRLMVKDEKFGGEIYNEVAIELNEETSIKEIISKRVEAEVKAYNLKADTIYTGLITPKFKEQILNVANKKKKIIDAEQQIYVALDAFQKNGFFVLIDDIQVEDIDAKISVKQDSKISFVKLTQLIGG